jgi:hypothetical protein
VELLGLDWAFTLKDNQPELLREAECFTQESPTGVPAEPGRKIRYGHLPKVDWPVADRLARVVKTVRIEHLRRVTVSENDGHRIKSRRRWRKRAPTSTPLTSNSAPSRRCSFISSAAAVGVSIPKFSDHHHRLSPQTPCGPSNYGPGGADHDPVSCLYPLPGLLPPPDPQPCARKMRDLSRMRQENRLVRGPGRQQRLISTYADRDVFSQGSTAKLTKRRR